MAKRLTVAVFADCGQTGHGALYRKAGEALAERGIAIAVVGVTEHYPADLVAAALAKGGEVTLTCADADRPGTLPKKLKVVPANDARDAGRLAAQSAGALIGLPGEIAASAALYRAWADVGGNASGKPVGLLNRKRAFEIVRGFVSDVANPGLGTTDRLVVFAESVDDLIGKLRRLV